MITKQHIISLAEDFLKDSDKFIVDVNVLPGNKIEVFIDASGGLSIADCVNLSRHIEGSLDRDQEDFSLEVSSPGATEPFKVIGQFKKYTGSQVEAHTLDGQSYKGKLLAADDDGITIETSRRENKAVGKGKQTVIENITLTYKQLKETKSVLPF
ncbi:MAG: ribosome assembly cofactor RimP [Bacteroidetes bacterium]|nr:ribosome assembly cofactor RimP [Bacteroidota bacterium]